MLHYDVPSALALLDTDTVPVRPVRVPRRPWSGRTVVAVAVVVLPAFAAGGAIGWRLVEAGWVGV